MSEVFEESGEALSGSSLPAEGSNGESRQKGDDLFAPSGLDFHPVSFNWTKFRLTELAMELVIFSLTLGAMSVFLSHLYSWGFILLVAYAAWQLWLIPRQVRSWAYAQGDSDLVIRHGIMFKRLMAVPYGRMQFVDVKQGPLQRFFGIASLTLNTASPQTNAQIKGLAYEQASILRQVLTQKGESMRAGL